MRIKTDNYTCNGEIRQLKESKAKKDVKPLLIIAFWTTCQQDIMYGVQNACLNANRTIGNASFYIFTVL